MRTRLFLFVYGLAIGGLIGCGTAGGVPARPLGAISCTTEAIGRDWPKAYADVQTCLSAVMDSPMTCLDDIPRLLHVGIDVVACIVRSSGSEAASQQQLNPDDIVSLRRVERSRAWLEARRLVFEEGTPK